MRPSCAFISRPMEGVGNAGCPLHPRPRVHFVLVERTRATTSTPESPSIPARNGFNSLCRALPGDRAVLPPSSADMSCLSPVGPTQLRELDASVGASGPHDFAVREKRLSSARRLSLKSLSTRPAIPSRAKRCRVHRNPPRVRDDHDTPLLWGGMARLIKMFLPTMEAKYFCKWGWTPLSTNRPTGKSPHGSESKFRSCPGRGAAPFRSSAEPGPISTLRDGPRLGSAPLRAAEPGNAVAPPEVYQTCLMKECGESKFRSCPGRGAAFFTLLRRAGTYLDTSSMQPAQ